MTTQMTYRFGPGVSDGDASMKELLGGKGAYLAQMAKLGLPVPAGVTIPTPYCDKYQNDGEGAQVAHCTVLAQQVLHDFDQFVVPALGYMPLMSVRSGARVSMPGMMDTILNVGITSQNLASWRKRIGPRAAWDSYRRLIQMYASTVDGIPHEVFEETLAELKAEYEVDSDTDLTAPMLATVVDRYLKFYREVTERDFPDTLEEQLIGCIGAVFRSWMNDRAIEYRVANKIPHEWGTAVTVQSMVFGNLNDQSATGVLFTRDPNTGEPGLFGEFLINAQGEDVVAGIRTPEPLHLMAEWNPSVYSELEHWAFFMEAEGRDMQDMEFTVQDGQLFVLQTRTGKRSARAAFQIAYDLAAAELISWPEAVKRVNGKQYMALKRPTIAAGFKTKPTFAGLPAAGSVVTGIAVMTAAEAKQSKVPCILVREETTPDDFGGMMAAVGILTRTGGATSHAAVVARGMDKCCVVGASDMKFGKNIKAGDKVTLDGATGRVWVNAEVPVQAGGITGPAAYLAELARGYATAQTVRVTLDPNQWTMQLPSKGHVVLGVHALAASARGRRNIRLLLTELDKRPALSGVLDFGPEATGSHVDDVELLDLLGIGAKYAPVADGTINTDKVGQAVAYAKWTKKLLARWVVKGPAPLITVAGDRGWGTARAVTALSELISATGAVEVAPAMLERLKVEGVSLDDLLTLLKAAGKAVSVMPKAVDEDTLMFEVLGK